jgi:hypothetical protein
MQNSCLISNLLPDGMMDELGNLFPYMCKDLDSGFKYLGFFFKTKFLQICRLDLVI